MGNLSFIIPTTNLQDYNINSITTLLHKNVNNGKFIIDSKFNEIVVYEKNENRGPVCQLFFNQDCYLLNFEKDIKELEILGEEKAVKELQELQALNIDLDNIIQMKCLYDYKNYIKRETEIFLHQHFKAFIFDEGIHPEFIEPTYKYKSNKLNILSSIIKKIINIWKN